MISKLGLEQIRNIDGKEFAKVKVVSVIIPIYKGNKYLKNLIAMMEHNWIYANQNDKIDIELILVNDFPEEKLCIRPEWLRNIRMTELTNDRNSGIHFSRVNGLLHSKGEWVLFLDQDDWISPIYIREQMSAIGSHDAWICNGKYRSECIYKNGSALAGAVDRREYINGCNRIVSPGQVLLKRSAIPKEWLENIMEINGADDYFLWILMFKNNCKFGIYDKVLYWHQETEDNTSADYDKMDASVYEMLDKLLSLRYLSEAEAERIRSRRITAVPNEMFSPEELWKEQNYKSMLNLWLTLRERRISVTGYLKTRKISDVAIYGYGMFGKHLYYELKDSEIEVKYILDRSESVHIDGVEKVKLGDTIKGVDAIIVTPFMEIVQIRGELKKYYSCEVISLRTILLNADCELMSV